MMLAAALAYARRGLPVFPLLERDKRPFPGSSGFHDATVDPDQIRRWWARTPLANVGVATGGPGGLAVLDLDRKHGDPEAMLDALAASIGADPPATARVLTGGGGLHLWFRLRDGAELPSVNGSATAGLGVGCDLKCSGGYVVAPPSVHASGMAYRWEDEGDNGLSAVPRADSAWLERVCDRYQIRGGGGRAAGPTGAGGWAGRRLDWPTRKSPEAPPSPRWRLWLERGLAEAVAEIEASKAGGRHDSILVWTTRIGGKLRTVPVEALAEVGDAAVERLSAAVAVAKPEIGASEVARLVLTGVGYAAGVEFAGGGGGALPDRPAPTTAEMRGLWFAGGPVAADAEAAAWCRSRGLDPAALDDTGSARVMPATGAPGWARSWARDGYRLLAPLYGAGATLAAVRGRAVRPAEIKSRLPWGVDVAGLVLADPAARAMMEGQRTVREVWIAEGEVDVWTLALADLDALREGELKPRHPSLRFAGAPWAVLGVVKGAWRAKEAGLELAKRIPADVRILLATDKDKAGDAYAVEIAKAVRDVWPERPVWRMVPPDPHKDWNEWWIERRSAASEVQRD